MAKEPSLTKLKSGKYILQSRLRELLSYDSDTGNFEWRTYRPGNPNGLKAGTNLNTGYIQIRVDGEFWLAHRLAWLYIHGTVPKELDHINQKKDDNRIANLRPAEHWMQMHNSLFRPKSKYGYRGIAPKTSSKRNPWKAYTTIMGKYKYLGSFPTKERAAKAYNDAIIERMGEFAGPLLNQIPE